MYMYIYTSITSTHTCVPGWALCRTCVYTFCSSA